MTFCWPPEKENSFVMSGKSKNLCSPTLCQVFIRKPLAQQSTGRYILKAITLLLQIYLVQHDKFAGVGCHYLIPLHSSSLCSLLTGSPYVSVPFLVSTATTWDVNRRLADLGQWHCFTYGLWLRNDMGSQKRTVCIICLPYSKKSNLGASCTIVLNSDAGIKKQSLFE